MADTLYNAKLISFLKKNKDRVLSGTISEKEAVEASGIVSTKIGPALWQAEPVAVPECRIKPTEASITKARKDGIRWERIARRTELSVAEAKEIGGVKAAEVARPGAGRQGNGSSSSGRRKAATGKAVSGRRQKSGAKKESSSNGRRRGARTRAERQAKAGNPS